MDRIVRLGAAASLVIVLVGMTGLGLNGAIQEQPKLQWVYVGGALLAFVSGFLVTMVVVSHLHQRFQIEVKEEENKVGRLLSDLEIKQVGARFREKREQGGIPFPLQRLVIRLLLLLPAVVLISSVVVIGAFFGGFFLAAFVEEYRKRTLPYF
jgi:RsiW-degrading membrane proteinase PrsW (M82 family)